jgi:succinate dehydrogenase / fumarate reductase cytochrome b subunit
LRENIRGGNMFGRREKRYKTKYNLAGTSGLLTNLKYNLERYLYLLHRITGIGLVAYLILHIFVTGTRLYGPEAYEVTHKLTANPIADIGLFFVMAGLIFHGVNGIRLIINEFGLLLGKPKRPEYPYRQILKTGKPRGLLLLMVAIGIILLLIVAYELLVVWVF